MKSERSDYLLTRNNCNQEMKKKKDSDTKLLSGILFFLVTYFLGDYQTNINTYSLFLFNFLNAKDIFFVSFQS